MESFDEVHGSSLHGHAAGVAVGAGGAATAAHAPQSPPSHRARRARPPQPRLHATAVFSRQPLAQRPLPLSLPFLGAAPTRAFATLLKDPPGKDGAAGEDPAAASKASAAEPTPATASGASSDAAAGKGAASTKADSKSDAGGTSSSSASSASSTATPKPSKPVLDDVGDDDDDDGGAGSEYARKAVSEEETAFLKIDPEEEDKGGKILFTNFLPTLSSRWDPRRLLSAFGSTEEQVADALPRGCRLVSATPMASEGSMLVEYVRDPEAPGGSLARQLVRQREAIPWWKRDEEVDAAESAEAEVARSVDRVAEYTGAALRTGRENWLRFLLGDIKAHPVRGEPFVHDMPPWLLLNTVIRVEGRSATGTGEGAALPDAEDLFPVLRAYGRVSKLERAAPNPITKAPGIEVAYRNIRGAVAARHCLDHAIVRVGGGRSHVDRTDLRLRLRYVPRGQTGIVAFYANHPRIMIPMTALVVAFGSYVMFDPIRVWSIRQTMHTGASLRSSLNPVNLVYRVRAKISRWVGPSPEQLRLQQMQQLQAMQALDTVSGATRSASGQGGGRGGGAAAAGAADGGSKPQVEDLAATPEQWTDDGDDATASADDDAAVPQVPQEHSWLRRKLAGIGLGGVYSIFQLAGPQGGLGSAMTARMAAHMREEQTTLQNWLRRPPSRPIFVCGPHGTGKMGLVARAVAHNALEDERRAQARGDKKARGSHHRDTATDSSSYDDPEEALLFRRVASQNMLHVRLSKLMEDGITGDEFIEGLARAIGFFPGFTIASVLSVSASAISKASGGGEVGSLTGGDNTTTGQLMKILACTTDALEQIGEEQLKLGRVWAADGQLAVGEAGHAGGSSGGSASSGGAPAQSGGGGGADSSSDAAGSSSSNAAGAASAAGAPDAASPLVVPATSAAGVELEQAQAPLIIFSGFSEENHLRFNEAFRGLVAWAEQVTARRLARVVFVCEEHSLTEYVRTELPDARFDVVALQDASPGSAASFVRTSTSHLAHVKAEDVERAVEIVGGRFGDLVTLVARITDGLTPEAAAKELVATATLRVWDLLYSPAAAFKTSSGGTSAKEGSGALWSQDQLWDLIGLLVESEDGRIPYDRALYRCFDGDDRALRSLVRTDALRVVSTASWRDTLEAGSPVMLAAFRQLVSRPVLKAGLDYAMIKAERDYIRKKVERTEAELATLAQGVGYAAGASSGLSGWAVGSTKHELEAGVRERRRAMLAKLAKYHARVTALEERMSAAYKESRA